jgi:ubiquinone/menaquinone biosynthesis C-methylase UbiE
MPDSKLNFAFDQRVSEEYDRLRAHPAPVSRQIGETIVGLAGKSTHVLELGVGTGRIALPVLAAGCSVVGVDLSLHMLGHLQNRIAGHEHKLNLVRADISQLPFCRSCFDAVTAVHVLHLVPEWRAVLSDAVAVLRPNGRIILGRDWIDPTSMAGQIQDQFRRVVVEIMGPQLKAPTSTAAIASAINEFGAQTEHLGPTDVVAAEWMMAERPCDIIHAIRTRSHAESWVLTDEFITPVVDRIESFAKGQWRDLEQEFPVKRRFLLSVFRASVG